MGGKIVSVTNKTFFGRGKKLEKDHLKLSTVFLLNFIGWCIATRNETMYFFFKAVGRFPGEGLPISRF
jgi:hypothetical protein